MKSEHLFCNFSHFVLLLLSCSQAVCNLFPQKPAVSLKLEKTVPGEARSKKPCVVDGVDPSPHRLSHPGCSREWRPEASGLLPCKCSQEALKWGGSPDYSPRSLFCCFVCFSVHSLFPLATLRMALPHVCYLYVTCVLHCLVSFTGGQPAQFLTCPHLLHPLPLPSHLRLHPQSCSFQLMDLTMSPNNLSWGLND